MKRVRVVVTAEDIAAGERRIGDRCPVGLAVRRAGFPCAHVGAVRWFPNRGPLDTAVSVPLSPQVIAWIDNFDNFKPVEPKTFYLTVPE